MSQSASIGPRGEPTPSVAETRDARELREARAEIARLASELDRERDLRLDAERERATLAARAAGAIASRDEFLGAAAHDLKTPLAALKLQVQGLLRRGPTNLDPGATAGRLRSMNRQIVHMTDLLDRLFEIGRGDEGALDLVPDETDLVEVVADITDRYAEDLAWARCPLTLRLPDAPVVGRWDRMRLDQAVTNLVSNAMKYGRAAPIEIEISSTRDHAVLKVVDHGAGIPAAEIGRIFEKYVRSEKRRSISGLGLGLWIVQRIVAGSGGTINVESELGVGSTFTLILPRSPLNPP